MRTLHLAAALLLSASAALAQSPPKNIILADWERTKANLLAYVDAAPDSMMGYRPTPGVRTWAEQFEHIVATNVDVAAQAIKGLQHGPVLGDTAQYLHRKAALRAYVAATYDYAIAAIREATPAQLNRVSSIYRQPEAPAWRWVELTHEHSVWTFGQLIAYLRLNGVTPPSYNMPL